MQLTKPKGQDYWHVTFKTESGKRRSVNTLCKTREEAEELAKAANIPELEKAAKTLRLTAEVVTLITADKTVTVWDAAGEWDQWLTTGVRAPKTRENHRSTIQCWMKDMGLAERPVGSIETKDIHDWVNRFGAAKMGTRSHWLSSIRSFLSYCTTRRWILSDPSQLAFVDHRRLSHEQKEEAHKKVFADEEVLFLLAKASGAEPDWMTPGFIPAAIILGRDLGLRLGDICNLEWACFNFGRMVATVHNGKTGARVEVPMTPRVASLLTKLQQDDSRFVFPRERATYANMDRRPMISMAFTRFFAKNGFKGYSFHSLRATLATTMAAQGKTMDEIAEALGHTDKKTTKVYVKKDGAAQVNLRK